MGLILAYRWDKRAHGLVILYCGSTAPSHGGICKGRMGGGLSQRLGPLAFSGLMPELLNVLENARGNAKCYNHFEKEFKRCFLIQVKEVMTLYKFRVYNIII